MNIWDWCFIDYELERAQEAHNRLWQQQNEILRRNGLSPAERAAEDAAKAAHAAALAREAEALAREAEARRQRIRALTLGLAAGIWFWLIRTRFGRATLLVLFLIAGIWGWLAWRGAQEPDFRAAGLRPVSAQVALTPSDDPVVQPEHPELEPPPLPRQIEPANPGPSPTPTASPSPEPTVRRAKLVRLHHKHH